MVSQPNPRKYMPAFFREQRNSLSRVTSFPACSPRSQFLLFTLAREQRMKTSTSTKHRHLFKVFFPQSCGKEVEGENCVRLWIIFSLCSDVKGIDVAV